MILILFSKKANKNKNKGKERNIKKINVCKNMQKYLKILKITKGYTTPSRIS